jgi:hypothetical protein
MIRRGSHPKKSPEMQAFESKIDRRLIKDSQYMQNMLRIADRSENYATKNAIPSADRARDQTFGFWKVIIRPLY